jgi:hypothetical protein
MDSNFFCLGIYSTNCKRELFSAIKYSKFIVPLLIRDFDNKDTHQDKESAAKLHTTGWTGPGPSDPDWWKHAQKCCEEACDPDSRDRIDFSALAKFTPIDMRGEQQMEFGSLAEGLLMSKISSRFHRLVRF